MARLGPKQTCSTSFRIMRKVCHLYSWHFTTQGSDTYSSSGEMGNVRALTEETVKIQCQVSTDGTLKCLPLYCKTQWAEQKQEGEGMYKVLWYKRFSWRNENATRHCTQFIWGWLFIPERPCPCVSWGIMGKSLILPTVFSGKNRLCLFPYRWRGFVIRTFIRMHTAIYVPHWGWSIGV